MTNDTRSPEEIERDIERERAGLSHTLDDLQDRFSVEGVAREVTAQFREHGGDIGRSVSEAVKRNPLGLALTGVGLAWLMFGDKSPRRGGYDSRGYVRRSFAGDNRDRIDYSDYDDPYRDYGNDRRDLYVGRTPTHGTEPRRSTDLGTKQPGSSSQGYYSGEYRTGSLPSWARGFDDDGGTGIGDRAKSAASSVGDSARGAGSSVAAGARSTRDAAASAGSSVAGGARSAGSSVASGARSARDAAASAGSSVAGGVRDASSAAAERARRARARISEGTEQLSEEARNRVIAARERAITAWEQAGVYGRRGQERAADLYEDNPLVAGALAVAVGAALAAALPRSRAEDEYLGEHSDALFDEAERIYADEKSKLTKVAQAATDEAKKIADEAKKDADDKADADNATQDAVDKAKSAGQRVADAAKSEADKQKVGDVSKS